jgi:hypothetical protein
MLSRWPIADGLSYWEGDAEEANNRVICSECHVPTTKDAKEIRKRFLQSKMSMDD